MKRIKKVHLILLLLIVFVVAGGALLPYAYKNKGILIQNQIVQTFIPLYHSVRKIPDIIFIPQNLFTKSDLERYELYISDSQLRKLNAQLNSNAFSSTLEAENKVWVDAEFRAPGYTDNVKVKYRGRLANHWNSYKKSYAIKFPKDNLFRGMREIKLIIPYDRKYFTESLNNHRARKMGQVVPDEFYVRLSVNGSSDGVMLASEQWSQEWLEKQPISTLSSLFGVGEFTTNFSAYSTPGLPFWKSWNNEADSFPQMEALITLIEDASDEEFEKLAPSLLDLESFYAKDTIHVLAGVYHAGDNGNNIVLLFDATEGRFKTIPFNAGLAVKDRVYEVSYPILEERIWSIDTFREARDDYFRAYVDENIDGDLEFVDNWIEVMKPEFYADNAKLHNNFMFASALEEARESVVRYSTLDTTVFDAERTQHTFADDGKPLVFPEEFTFLLDSALAPGEFAQINPRFKVQNGDIVLSRGTYTFNNSVVVPRDTKLVIEAGTSIKLGKDVSIISYSPVELIGTSAQPITFSAASDRPWGSLAVLNTKEESQVEHVTFTDGSELSANGIWFSGMVAFHNADVRIASSTFKDIEGEDGLNVKGGRANVTNSTFDTSLSDGVDLDYVTDDSIFSHNMFKNIGGDAIDISWTNIEITNNQVSSCTDKGISVGESSKPTIIGNTVQDCDMGIAIKDSSETLIKDNVISNNRIGVAAYNKKPYFEGGKGVLEGNTFSDNEEIIWVDEFSIISEW